MRNSDFKGPHVSPPTRSLFRDWWYIAQEGDTVRDMTYKVLVMEQLSRVVGIEELKG